MSQIVSFFVGVILAIAWLVICIIKRKCWRIGKVIIRILLGLIIIAAFSFVLMLAIDFFGLFGWWGLLIIAIIIGIFTPTVYHVKIHK